MARRKQKNRQQKLQQKRQRMQTTIITALRAGDLQRGFNQLNQLKIELGNHPDLLTESLKTIALGITDEGKSVAQRLAAFEQIQKECNPVYPLVESLNHYGVILGELEQYDAAIEKFKQALDFDSNDTEVWTNYGVVLSQLKQYKAAIEKFQQALNIDPNYAGAWTNYGAVLTELGEYEAAIEKFQQALNVDLNHAGAWTNYGAVLTELGEYEVAIEKFQQALNIDPNNARIWTNYGTALAKLGKYEVAIEKFQQALNIDPHHTNAWANYGTVLGKLGQTETAIEKFQQALKLDPNHAGAWTNYGTVLGKLGQTETAIEKFQQALKLDPNYVETWNNYGFALYELGQYDAAIEKFQKALDLDPNYVETLNNYGLLLYELGQYNAAVKKLAQAHKIVPDNQAIFWIEAILLQREGEYSEAIAILEEVDKPEQLIPFYLSLGRLHYLNQEPHKGRHYFDLVIQNTPDQDAARLAVAHRIFADNPYSEEGIKILQEVTEESPHYEDASHTLKINLPIKDFFERFNPPQEAAVLRDTEMLNRAFYHKIANEIGVLKSLAQRIAYQLPTDKGTLHELIEDIEVIPERIKQRREQGQADYQALAHHSYDQLMQVISETAQDISDSVNNELAAIESKVRRVMRQLPESASSYPQFNNLLSQLEYTQEALNDLKSINEGITIRYRVFPVRNLFAKWLEAPALANATIQLDIQNGDSQFRGDAEKIKSVINELVENSIKHNAAHPTLQITMASYDTYNPPAIRSQDLASSQKFLGIVFRDNGRGIPADKKDWIFLPLKTTSPQEKGSGLGLFIIKRTIEKMQGHIIETGSDGARFEIYLPYLTEEEYERTPHRDRLYSLVAG